MRCPHCGNLLRASRRNKTAAFVCLTCGYGAGVVGGNIRKRKSAGSKKTRLHKIYLIDPTEDLDVNNLAEEILGLEHVQELVISDHECGLVLKTRFFTGKEPSNAVSYLADKLGSHFRAVVNGAAYDKYRIR